VGLGGSSLKADRALTVSVTPNTMCGVKQVAYGFVKNNIFEEVVTTTMASDFRWEIDDRYSTGDVRTVAAQVTNEVDQISRTDASALTLLKPFAVRLSAPQVSETAIHYTLTHSVDIFQPNVHVLPSGWTGLLAGLFEQWMPPFTITQASRSRDGIVSLITLTRHVGLLSNFPASYMLVIDPRDEDGRVPQTTVLPSPFSFAPVPSFFQAALALLGFLTILLLALLILWFILWWRGMRASRELTVTNTGNTPAQFGMRARGFNNDLVRLSGPGVRKRLGKSNAVWFQIPEIAATGTQPVTVSLQRLPWEGAKREATVSLYSAVLGLDKDFSGASPKPFNSLYPEPDNWESREPILIELPDRRWFWLRHALLCALTLLAIVFVIYLIAQLFQVAFPMSKMG
jgi:hypothetical protein